MLKSFLYLYSNFYFRFSYNFRYIAYGSVYDKREGTIQTCIKKNLG